jgi:hypothetical protein
MGPENTHRDTADDFLNCREKYLSYSNATVFIAVVIVAIASSLYSSFE